MFKLIFAASTILSLLFGAPAAAEAVKNSKPGEALYSMKMWSEQVMVQSQERPRPDDGVELPSGEETNQTIQLEEQTQEQLQDQTCDQDCDPTQDQVQEQAQDQLHDQTCDQDCDQTQDQIQEQLQDQTCDQTQEQLQEQTQEQLHDQDGTHQDETGNGNGPNSCEGCDETAGPELNGNKP